MAVATSLVLLLVATIAPAVAADAVERGLQRGVAAAAAMDAETAAAAFAAASAAAEPGSLAWQRATLGGALAERARVPATRTSLAAAAALDRALIARCPASPLAARAQLELGRIAELGDEDGGGADASAARAAYAAVVAAFPDAREAGEATLRLAALDIATGDAADVRRGIARLDAWLDAHPDEALAAGMWQYLGDTWFTALGDDASALRCYQAAVRLGLPDPAASSGTCWRMAKLAERLGRRDEAIAAYRELIRDAPSGGKAWEARQAIARLVGDADASPAR